MLYHWESTRPDSPYLLQPMNGKYQAISWKQAGDQIRRMASALKAQNFPPGSSICIASKNCAHWIMADMAIWMAGHVSVPIYPNLSSAMIREIIDHSESKLVFIGKLDDVQTYLKGTPDDLIKVSFPYNAPASMPSWDQWIKSHEPLKENPTRNHDDLATIIYTSGTTGTPKGVMHRFSSFSDSASRIIETIQLSYEERFFSYLPLAHVAERLLTENVGLYCGGQVWFVESIDSFADNLKETQPTVFLGVPRIWEKFQVGILEKLPQKKMSLLLKIPLISSLIRKKIQAGLGLNQSRFNITGAAPISTDLLEWYDKLGIKILEAYGLSENFAYSHFARPESIRIGYVGNTWPGVTTKISDQGEVMVKSPGNMAGYFKQDELTKEIFTDEFLHTGDQGEIDSEGRLKITGRVKDLFKSSKGKYIAPNPIELKLSASNLVDQACVVGTGLPQPIALVNLSEEALRMNSGTVEKQLGELMESVNQTLDPHERMRKIVIMKEAWTVENEYLTPTMKLKRNKVEGKYQDSFSLWSNSEQTVLHSEK